jgi:hypothetical protein
MACLLGQARSNLSATFPEVRRDAIRLPRLECMPLGVEDEFCDPFYKRVARRLLAIPDSATVLLYLGRFSEEYKANLSVLVESFRCLAEDFPSAALILAGNAVHSLGEVSLHSLGLPPTLLDRVLIIQNFPRVMKKTIYSAADIFVSPVDNVQESFGLSLLEAMACGLPIVASNWNGYRDLVVHGETGFLVDTLIEPSAWNVADALAAFALPPSTEGALAGRTVVHSGQLLHYLRLLLSNASLRQRLGSAGLERVRSHFVWTKVIRTYIDLWRDQLKECGPAGETQPPPLRLRPAFEHYASIPYQPQSILIHSSEATIRAFHNRFPTDDVGLSILKNCAAGAITLHSLISHADHGMARAASALLKAGYLRIVTNDADAESSKRLPREGSTV